MSYIERLVVNDESKTTILYDEHMVRYRFIAPLVKNKKVLDIACGSGYGAALLHKAGAESVLGIDLDEAVIAEARKQYPGIEFKAGDAGKLDLANESIDVITSFETIEHLPAIEQYLSELKRVIKETGLVSISTPNKKVFGQKNPFHIKEFTKEEFEAVLRNHFPVVRIFEQKNALSSFILKDTEKGNILINDDKSEALYFIAVCSKKEIELDLSSVISTNISALKNWENNPGWKLVNAIYKVLQKLKIV